MGSGEKISIINKLPIVLFTWSSTSGVLKAELGSLDHGIVLVADNHRIARQFLLGYCEADGSNGRSYRSWNSKAERPGNYQAGLLLLTNDIKRKDVESFLTENSFTPVLVSGGAIPEYLTTECLYALKLEGKDNDLVRSTVFSDVIQEISIYIKENIDEICKMLQRLPNTIVMMDYSGAQEMKSFYMYIMAVGKMLQMFFGQTATEETAEIFFVKYQQEWGKRIASIPKFFDASDIIRRFNSALSEYLQQHPEIQTGRIDYVETDLMNAVDRGCAILHDDRYVYCPEEQFAEITAPLRITLSSPMLKKMCAESGLIKKDAEGYSPKKQYTSVYGIPVRKHFVWIDKQVFLDEADDFLRELFGKKHVREESGWDVHEVRQSDCSTRFYLGRNDQEQVVTISKNSPNNSILITGISGSGKSCAIAGMERQIVQNGGTVLEIDIHGNRQMGQDDNCHMIQVHKAGLSEAFIAELVFTDDVEYECCSRNIVEILSASVSASGRVLGENQIESLRSAVEDSLRNIQRDERILSKIADRLRGGDKTGRKVYDKLQPLLSSDVFRKGGGEIESGKINIISFAGLDDDARRMAIEILLESIMKKRRRDSDETAGISVVIDEFQHLSLKQGLSIHQILTEGRKYGINLIFATQFVAGFERDQKAVIEQAAVKMFFRQADSEARNVAGKISTAKRDAWESKLKALKIGDAVAVGTFSAGDREIRTPLVLHSEYKP